MTETVRFFDSVSYDEGDIADVFTDFYGLSFVLPEDNRLEITSSGAADAGIVVDTGYAFHQGVWYENTEEVSFTISAQGGGNNRLDRIVLRKDAANNQVRLTVIEGVAAVAPSLPALTADDMPLFYIWVANGFGAGSTVDNRDIHDERDFYLAAPRWTQENYENILYNSEFLAYSTTALGTAAPEGWQFNRVAGSVTGTTPTNNVQRGQALDIVIAGPSTEYISQFLLISPNADDPENTYFTLKGSMEITSGEALVVVHDGTSTIASKLYRRTGETFEFLIRFAFDVSSQLTTPLIRLYSNTANLDMILNPVKLVYGFSPGPFERKHEFIKTDKAIVDASWNDSLVGAGTTSIDLSASFGPYIPRAVEGVMGFTKIRDDASAGGSPSLTIHPHKQYAIGGKITLQSKVNDTKSEDQFFATITKDAAWGFDAEVVVAGNFRATMKILGIAT